MSLLTQEQFAQLAKNGSAKNRDGDHYPVVKLFLPGTACGWLLTQLDDEYPNIAFGLCDLGLGFPEIGSVSLEELQQVKTVFHRQVERDLHFQPLYPISVYAEAARILGYIIENHSLLALYASEGMKPMW